MWVYKAPLIELILLGKKPIDTGIIKRKKEYDSGGIRPF